MAITISDIQNETLQKYAQMADADKDGVLNEEESTSLFEKLKKDETRFEKRKFHSKDGNVSFSIADGVLSSATACLLFKSFRSFKSFGTLSILVSVGNYIGNKIIEKSSSSNLEKVQSAQEEYSSLMDNVA